MKIPGPVWVYDLAPDGEPVWDVDIGGGVARYVIGYANGEHVIDNVGTIVKDSVDSFGDRRVVATAGEREVVFYPVSRTTSPMMLEHMARLLHCAATYEAVANGIREACLIPLA